MKKSGENKKILKWLVAVFLIWRVGLELAARLGKIFLPQKLGYLGPSIWANFDGIHYLWIAQNGYGLYQQAFFPLYPWFVRWLTQFTHNYLFSGLLISYLAFFAGLYLLYRLLLLDYPEKIVRRAILFLFLFPTSFFFVSFYSESLFFFLMIATFYFARKGKWLASGIFGALASATRVVGIFLLPALLVEWGEQNKYKFQIPNSKFQINFKSQIPKLLSLFLIPMGLIFYMRYLTVHWGDPLLFVRVQEHFGAERIGGKIILLYQVFWRYFKMILTTKPDPLYFVVWLELLTAAGFLALLVWGYFQKIRLSWLVFGILAYLLPTITGTFSSLPRYVLVVFPGFIGLSLLSEKYRWAKIIYPVLAGILLVISTIFFIRGFWVS
jgi:hypothetical protein